MSFRHGGGPMNPGRRYFDKLVGGHATICSIEDASGFFDAALKYGDEIELLMRFNHHNLKVDPTLNKKTASLYI
jgi:hypothetical protein